MPHIQEEKGRPALFYLDFLVMNMTRPPWESTTTGLTKQACVQLALESCPEIVVVIGESR
eukprot:7693994-Pyramimonas_sp.AAC.1